MTRSELFLSMDVEGRHWTLHFSRPTAGCTFHHALISCTPCLIVLLDQGDFMYETKECNPMQQVEVSMSVMKSTTILVVDSINSVDSWPHGKVQSIEVLWYKTCFEFLWYFWHKNLSSSGSDLFRTDAWSCSSQRCTSVVVMTSWYSGALLFAWLFHFSCWVLLLCCTGTSEAN